tara:strand:+ start:2738 stop:3241 length:504 start_codon:yes stop_codon:yes gene_type:complete
MLLTKINKESSNPMLYSNNNLEPQMMSDGDFEKAVLVIADAPSRRDLKSALDRLPVSADAKSLLHDLANLTITVGKQILAIGRKIVSFALSLAKTFPNTIFGVILGVVLTVLIGSISLLGPLLAPVLGPLFVGFGLSMGAVNDMRNGDLHTRVDEFVMDLQGLSVGR